MRRDDQYEIQAQLDSLISETQIEKGEEEGE